MYECGARRPVPRLDALAQGAILAHLSALVLPRLLRRWPVEHFRPSSAAAAAASAPRRAGTGAPADARAHVTDMTTANGCATAAAETDKSQKASSSSFRAEFSALRRFFSARLNGPVHRALNDKTVVHAGRDQRTDVFLRLLLVDGCTERLEISAYATVWKRWSDREKLTLLRTLRAAHKLKAVYLPGNATDAALQSLAENCPLLETLCIGSSHQVTDDGVLALIGVKRTSDKAAPLTVSASAAPAASAASEKRTAFLESLETCGAFKFAAAAAASDGGGGRPRRKAAQKALESFADPAVAEHERELKRRRLGEEEKRQQLPIVAKLKRPELNEFALELDDETVLYEFSPTAAVGCWKLRHFEAEDMRSALVTKASILSLLLTLPNLRHVEFPRLGHIVRLFTEIVRDHDLQRDGDNTAEPTLKLEHFADYSHAPQNLYRIQLACPNVTQLDISVRTPPPSPTLLYKTVFNFRRLSRLRIDRFDDHQLFRAQLAAHGQRLTALELVQAPHLTWSTIATIARECRRLAILSLDTGYVTAVDDEAPESTWSPPSSRSRRVACVATAEPAALAELRQLKLSGVWPRTAWVEFLLRDAPALEVVVFSFLPLSFAGRLLTDDALEKMLRPEINPLAQLKAFYLTGHYLSLTERSLDFLVGRLPSLELVGILDDWNVSAALGGVDALRRRARDANARIQIDNYENGQFKKLRDRQLERRWL